MAVGSTRAVVSNHDKWPKAMRLSVALADFKLHQDAIRPRQPIPYGDPCTLPYVDTKRITYVLTGGS